MSCETSDPAILQAQIGPVAPMGDGTVSSLPRIDRQGAGVFNFACGEYEELASRGELFCACNQAETIFTTGLTASNVNFSLSNPTGSPVDLVLLQIGIACRISSTAGHVVLAANVNPFAANVTHTTPLTVRNCKLDGSAGYGRADEVSTLPAAPVAIMALLSMGVTVTGEGQAIQVKGAVTIPPGTSVAVEGITVVGRSIISMIWHERKRLAA